MPRMDPTSHDDLLTPREVAETLGVRATTVAMWARIGALKPAVHTPGGHRRYRRADVQAFREGREPKAPPSREQEHMERMEQDAARLYAEGWSIRRLAARFECGYGTMRRVLLRRTTLRNGR